MFLVGQNEFNRTLMSTDCRALRQRITLSYNIKPLSEEETLEYIRYRLKVAGAEEEIFLRKAVGEVYGFSQGYPRLINIICDHALLTGFVRQAKKITPTIIKECSKELCLTGDTIRISSSDFFDGTTAPSKSLPPEARPTDDAALGVNVPGRTNGEGRTGQSREAMRQGIPAAETAETTPTRESRVGVIGQEEPKSRYWVVAGFVTLIALLSALLLQKDILLGTSQTERRASTKPNSSPGFAETNHSVPPPGAQETVTLAPAEPLAAVKQNGKLTSAKPSPYARARAEIDKGNADEALKLLEDAIADSPADLPRLRVLYSETLRHQAEELSRRGEPGAERLLTRAVEADPTNKEAYFDLGKIHTKAKRYPQAIRAYRKAADLDNRSADTFFNLGFVYAKTGDYRSAEKMYLRVATLRPPYLDKALFNLAAVQCKQNKIEQCAQNLEAALAENPDNQRARIYLSQLNRQAKGSM
jgi:tetratricopeptide (TPR) repeat protein